MFATQRNIHHIVSHRLSIKWCLDKCMKHHWSFSYWTSDNIFRYPHVSAMLIIRWSKLCVTCKGVLCKATFLYCPSYPCSQCYSTGTGNLDSNKEIFGWSTTWTEALHAIGSTQPGFKLMTFRSWQYIFTSRRRLLYLLGHQWFPIPDFLPSLNSPPACSSVRPLLPSCVVSHPCPFLLHG